VTDIERSLAAITVVLQELGVRFALVGGDRATVDRSAHVVDRRPSNASRAVELIEARGFQRGRDLVADLAAFRASLG